MGLDDRRRIEAEVARRRRPRSRARRRWPGATWRRSGHWTRCSSAHDARRKPMTRPTLAAPARLGAAPGACGAAASPPRAGAAARPSGVAPARRARAQLLVDRSSSSSSSLAVGVGAPSRSGARPRRRRRDASRAASRRGRPRRAIERGVELVASPRGRARRDVDARAARTRADRGPGRSGAPGAAWLAVDLGPRRAPAPSGSPGALVWRPAPLAVLAQRDAIGVVALALVGLVVAALALLAGEGDSDPHVSAGHTPLRDEMWGRPTALGTEKRPAPGESESSVARIPYRRCPREGGGARWWGDEFEWRRPRSTA